MFFVLRSHLLPRCVLDCLSFLAPTLISMLAPQPLRSGSPELPERLIPGLECSGCVGLVAQSCPTFCDCMECSPPGSSLCPWGLPRQEYQSGLPCASPWHLPNPGIEPRSPTLQPPGKPIVLGEIPGNTELAAFMFVCLFSFS